MLRFKAITRACYNVRLNAFKCVLMPLCPQGYNYKGVGSARLLLCGCVCVRVRLSPSCVRAEKLLRLPGRVSPQDPRRLFSELWLLLWGKSPKNSAADFLSLIFWALLFRFQGLEGFPFSENKRRRFFQLHKNDFAFLSCSVLPADIQKYFYLQFRAYISMAAVGLGVVKSFRLSPWVVFARVGSCKF